MEVRELPAVEKRVETGPVRFGDDWTGVFIRGDNAFGLLAHLCPMIETMPKDSLSDMLTRSAVVQVCRLLASSIEGPHGESIRARLTGPSAEKLVSVHHEKLEMTQTTGKGDSNG